MFSKILFDKHRGRKVAGAKNTKAAIIKIPQLAYCQGVVSGVKEGRGNHHKVSVRFVNLDCSVSSVHDVGLHHYEREPTLSSSPSVSFSTIERQSSFRLVLTSKKLQ